MVKAPILHCREQAKYTADKRGIKILFPQGSPQAGRLVIKTTSRRYYGKRKPNLYTPDMRGIEILFPQGSP